MRTRTTALSLTLLLFTGCFNAQLEEAEEDLATLGYDQPRAFEYELRLQRSRGGEVEVIESGRLEFDAPDCTSITYTDSRLIRRGDKHWTCSTTLEGASPENSRDIWPYDETTYTVWIDPQTNTVEQVLSNKTKYAGKPPEKGSPNILMRCEHQIEATGSASGPQFQGTEVVACSDQSQYNFADIKLEITEVPVE